MSEKKYFIPLGDTRQTDSSKMSSEFESKNDTNFNDITKIIQI